MRKMPTGQCQLFRNVGDAIWLEIVENMDNERTLNTVYLKKEVRFALLSNGEKPQMLKKCYLRSRSFGMKVKIRKIMPLIRSNKAVDRREDRRDDRKEDRIDNRIDRREDR